MTVFGKMPSDFRVKFDWREPGDLSSPEEAVVVWVKTLSREVDVDGQILRAKMLEPGGWSDTRIKRRNIKTDPQVSGL